jgi:hypothetical protein
VLLSTKENPIFSASLRERVTEEETTGKRKKSGKEMS